MVEDVHPYGAGPRCCLVLASENPHHLAGFYTDLFGGESVTTTPAGAVTVHLPTGTEMVLYQRSHTCSQLRQSNGLALCLRCADLEGTRQRAVGLGAKVLKPVRTEAFGREQWLLDPEENRVLLWEDPPRTSWNPQPKLGP